jgi:uncharacterized membrane protein HdeD (DUF308 family)
MSYFKRNKHYLILQTTIIIFCYIKLNSVQFLFFLVFIPQGIYHLYKTLIVKERLWSNYPNWFFTIGGFLSIILGIGLIIEMGNI